MNEIPWTRYSDVIEQCKAGKYLLKRKKLMVDTIYELWHNNELEYKTSNYFDFLKMVQPIIPR